ncbi:MAG: ATP-binding protein [Deltaproteobacteria bacterium]|nr:ATP-binding protein [Deltaproteobacteria bacterium]
MSTKLKKAAVAVAGPAAHVVTPRDPSLAWRFLAEAMSEAAALVSPEGLIFYANPHLAQLAAGGASLIGRTLADLVAPEDVVVLQALLARATAGVARDEVKLLAVDGLLPLLLSVSPAIIEGMPVLSVVAADIREHQQQERRYERACAELELKNQALRQHQLELEQQNEELRRAQRALEDARGRYVDLYEQAPVAYLTLDAQGLIVDANRAATVLLRTSARALYRQPFTSYIARDDQDAWHLYRRGQRSSCDVHVATEAPSSPSSSSSSEPIWVRLEAIDGADAAGAPIVRVVLIDIRERKRLEATERLASMGMVAASVAHEINNPLSHVVNSVESLVEDIVGIADAAQRCATAVRAHMGEAAFVDVVGAHAELLRPAALAEVIARARQAVGSTLRIRAIARALTSFSRAEPGELVRVDVNRAIETALGLAMGEIKYRARLVKELGSLPTVHGSEGKLAQVFLNLLINAAHAIDDGNADAHRITVHSWADSNNVFVVVRDTGRGIARADLARIFDPFFTTTGEGTGLGLHISRSIVDELGGDLRAESEPGRGARFVVRLPIKSSLNLVKTPR